MKRTASNTGAELASTWLRCGGPLLVGLALTSVHAQVPRYHSPIEAPTPQVSLPAAPPAVTPNGKVVEYPIVRVNDQIIDNSDYERTQKQVLAEAQQGNVSPAELADRQKNLLRDMIDQQLLLSRGKELDINADAEVIRRLDDIRKQNHLDSMEALEKAVREQGISYEDWKASIKNSVITQEVVRDEVGRNIRLTPRDAQAYYEAHKQDFTSPERVHLSEILIPTPDDATDAQVQQAKAKADDVAAKLKAGGDFAALAKQYSGGPNADTGGDLGDFKRGDLGKVLEDQTFPLKAGEWTAPIRTRQGYVILKVTEHVQAGVQPFSAVEDQVQQAMYEEAIQPALRTYLTKLRENAYIDIAPGFVDTGASPKQTKPVFQGAAPLPTKKKQNKSRIDQRAAATAKNGIDSAGAKSATPAAKPASTLMANGKSKKVHREKIRFGQAPQNALPEAPEETLTPGADQGAGAASASQPAPGTAIEPVDNSNTVAANVEPTASPEPERKKTRYTARQATMEQEKAANKVRKAKSKAAAVAPAPTAEESAAEKAQAAPLGLNGDTASKKKKTKVKGAPKERIQEKAPEPPKPAPEPTPIPPRSVRQNGEPAVTPVQPTPAPASTTPPASTPDTTPASPPAQTTTTPQQ
jgi:peptidyl-prolyl cis-trans isomerase SurA